MPNKIPEWNPEEHTLDSYIANRDEQEQQQPENQQRQRDAGNLMRGMPTERQKFETEFQDMDAHQRWRQSMIDAGQYYIRGAEGPQLDNPPLEGYLGYWEDPQRIARYHNMIQSAPPGWELPPGFDAPTIEAAYGYYQNQNPGQSWWEWQRLPEDDPVHQILRQLPPPPADYMPERDKQGAGAIDPDGGVYEIEKESAAQIFPQHILSTLQLTDTGKYIIPASQLEQYMQPGSAPYGMPQYDWDLLPGWQKAAINFMPYLGPGMGAFAGGAILGGLMGVPGLIGGALAGGAIGKAAETNEDIMKAMIAIDWFADQGEKIIGVLAQLQAGVISPEKYGSVIEVLDNLPAAYEASRIAYEASFSDTTQSGEVYNWTLGVPEPEKWSAPEGQIASQWALTEARRRIMAGAAPEDVWMEMGSKFGFTGQMRDMLGHMLLDPLNFTGRITTGKPGQVAARLAGNETLAASLKLARGTRDPSLITGLREYGRSIRFMQPEEAARFNGLSRWFARVDVEGKPDYMTKSRLDPFFGLTAQARSAEVINHSMDGLQVLLESVKGDPRAEVAMLKAMAATDPAQARNVLDTAGLDGYEVPKWFRSSEGQVVPLALRDSLKVADEMLDAWDMSRPPAQLIDRLSQYMSDTSPKPITPEGLIKELHLMSVEEATHFFDSWANRLAETAGNTVDADAAGAAKAILQALSTDEMFQGINGVALKKAASVFAGADAAPFRPYQFTLELITAMTKHTEDWAVKWFGVKPFRWSTRLAGLVKRGQSLVLLGLNPTYFANNVIDNIIKMGWDGVLDMAPRQSRQSFIRRMGLSPARLKTGLNAAEIGDVDFASVDSLAIKNGDYTVGQAVREATRGEDWIQAADDFMRKGDKLSVFARASSKMEQWSSEIAMVTAMRQFFSRRWQEGDGFRNIPDDLDMILRTYDPDLPDRVRNAVRRGMNKKEIEDAVFSDLGRKSLADVLSPDERELMSAHFPEVYDALEQNVRGAMDDEGIRAAFQRAKDSIQKAVSKEIKQDMTKITQDAMVKARVEGTQGALDLFDGITQDRGAFWLTHLAEMDKVAEEASWATGWKRQQIWQRGTAIADRNWRSFQNVEGAKWLGIMDGLGVDDANFKATEQILFDQHMLWREFYQQRRDKMDNFFYTSASMDADTSSAEWVKIQRELSDVYHAAIVQEDFTQSQLDLIFSRQYGVQFNGDGPAAVGEAMYWRNAIRQRRRQMAGAMHYFRSGQLLDEWQMPKELIDQIDQIMTRRAGDDPIAQYTLSKQEREVATKAFMEQVYDPLVRDFATDSNGRAPGSVEIPQDWMDEWSQFVKELEDGNVSPIEMPEPVTPEIVRQALEDGRRSNEILREILDKPVSSRAENEHAYVEMYAVTEWTGLPNRVSYLRLKGTERDLPVKISYDLDYLKWYNDTGGHAVGDQMMQAFADVFREAIGDEAYHFHGDEYFSQHTTDAEAKAAIGRLDNLLDDIKVRFREIEVDAEGQPLLDADGNSVPILDVDGNPIEVEAGLGYGHGIGPDEKAADNALTANKAIAKRERGSEPESATRRSTPEGEENRPHEAPSDRGQSDPQEPTAAAGAEQPERAVDTITPDDLSQALKEKIRVRTDQLNRVADSIRSNSRRMELEAPRLQTRSAFRLTLSEVLKNEDMADSVLAVTDELAAYWGRENDLDPAKMYATFNTTYGGVHPDGYLGHTYFMDSGLKVVHAYQNANVSTMIHEVIHAWTDVIPDHDADTLAGWLKGEYDIDLSQGWHKGADNARAKELVARGFERYVADGIAPHPGLRTVFEKFKTWMTSIYKRITDSKIDIRLNDDVRDTFDVWMGKRPQMDEPPLITPPPKAPEPAPAQAATKLASYHQQKGGAAKALHSLLTALGIDEELMADPDFYIKVKREPYIDLTIERHGEDLHFIHWLKDSYDELYIDSEMVYKIHPDGMMWLEQTAVPNPLQGGEHRMYNGGDVVYANTLAKNMYDAFRDGEIMRPTKATEIARPDENTIRAIFDAQPNWDNTASQMRIVRKDLWGAFLKSNSDMLLGDKVDIVHPMIDEIISAQRKQPSVLEDLSVNEWTRARVEYALRNDDPIPDGVLEDYPDLAEQYLTTPKYDPDVASAWDDLNPKKQKPEQASLFTAGEDSPLFSGTAQKAKEETFIPPKQGQQGTLFDTQEQLRPAIDEPKPAPETSDMGPLFDAPAQDQPVADLSRRDAVIPDLKAQADQLEAEFIDATIENMIKRNADVFYAGNDAQNFGLWWDSEFREAAVDVWHGRGVENEKKFLDVYSKIDIEKASEEARRMFMEQHDRAAPPVEAEQIPVQQRVFDSIADIFTDPDALLDQKVFEQLLRDHDFDLMDETQLNFGYDIAEGVFNRMAKEIIDAGDDLDITIEKLNALELRIPRARRTAGKMKLQQFSTPLTISHAAQYAADVRKFDTIGEPTAGTGNLINGLIGRENVTVRVNEIDAGRRAVLDLLGVKATDLDLMSADWVLGADGKVAPPWANVVITNPPWGAYSRGIYGKPVNDPVRLNDWSQRFTALTMRRMPPDSRLVGVMPTNWLYTLDRRTREITTKTSDFVRWLRDNYYIRAMIESPPDAYKTRSAGVGSLLVVVDKSPDGGLKPIEAWGATAPQNWTGYAKLVKELAEGGTHAREAKAVQNGQTILRTAPAARVERPVSGPDATGLTDPNARAGIADSAPDRIGDVVDPIRRSPTRGTSGGTEPGTSGGTGTGPERFDPGRPAADVEPTGGPGGSAGRVEPDVTGDPTGRAVDDVGEPGVEAAAPPVVAGELRGTERGDWVIPGDYSDEFRTNIEAGRTAAVDSGAFTLYVGRSPLRDGDHYHPHPAAVVEAKTLTGVKYPELEEAYRPAPSVMDAVNRRVISVEANLDPVWAAIQQNDKFNSGILIADDVGMGKSRTAAAFVLDRIERGKKRILVVTKGQQNVDNLMNREFPGVYGGTADEYGGFIDIPQDFPAQRVSLNGQSLPEVKKNGADIPTFEKPAVYFITESEFMYFADAIERLRVDSVVVDEVHQFKNVGSTKRGQAWYKLHKDWVSRDTDFLYLSATPGVDLSDLQYLMGLKVWTPDGFEDWVKVITGEMSPEAAKAMKDNMAVLNAYAVKMTTASDNVPAKRVVLPNRWGEPTPALQLDELTIKKDSFDDWRVWHPDGHSYMDFTRGENEALIKAGMFKEFMEGMQYYSHENMTERNIIDLARRVDVEYQDRYPKPEVSQDVKKNMRITDAGDFVDKIEKGGWGKSQRTAFESTVTPAHAEQIMRELKLGGHYMSRDISRVGVDFGVAEYIPPPEAIKQFDNRVDVYRRIHQAWAKFGSMNKGPKKHAAMFGINGDIQGDAKRTLFDMRLPGIMNEADQALANGERVVISLVSVNEVAEGRGFLENAINKINTQQVDKIGKDMYSDPMEIPEALLEIAELREELASMPSIASPIDMLREKYGDRISFIIGATSVKDRIKAQNDFQSGKIDVVVISGAGKTGINLHDVTGDRKVHLIVGDYEWSATNFKQELGRVDRTGQRTSPKVSVMHTGSAGERKFVATISNRMKGLGATSKGGAESTGTGAMTEIFELGSGLDKIALQEAWRNLTSDQRYMFLDKYFQDPQVKGVSRATLPADAQALKKFLMALQSMKRDEANAILDVYLKARDEMRGSVDLTEDLASKTTTDAGQIVRETQLRDDLSLAEIKKGRSKHGIIYGTLTPNMNTIKKAIGADYERSNSWMKWTRFYDADQQRYVSGLIIPPSKIEHVCSVFGSKIRRQFKPATALDDIRAGDRIPIHGDSNAEWTLYEGTGGYRERLIVIDGARMRDRDAIMNHGAIYSAQGNFFHIPEGKLQSFLKRFNIREVVDEGAGKLFQAAPEATGTGKTTHGIGQGGQRYEMVYRIVDLDELVTSHTDNLDPNPDYPHQAGVQPRKETREGQVGREQVASIGSKLDPDILLQQTTRLDDGSPIMGADHAIESGNGRVMALRYARNKHPEKWANYIDALRQRLDQFGMSEADIEGIANPVLVRERVTDVDRAKFAGEANLGNALTMTELEKAGLYQQYIEPSMLENLQISEGATIEAALRLQANDAIVTQFLSKIPETALAEFAPDGGQLSIEGARLMKLTMLRYVYPGEAGERLMMAFASTATDTGRNVGGAIYDSLGQMAKVEALIQGGKRASELSIADDLAKSFDMYVRLRNNGENVADYIGTDNLFGDEELTAFQKSLLGYIDQNARRKSAIRELISGYAMNVIDDQPDPNQGALFGGEAVSKGEILDGIASGIRGQETSFAEATTERPPAPQAAPEVIRQPAGNVPEVIRKPAGNVPVSPEAMGAPLGTGEGLVEPPLPEAQFMGWMKDVAPVLDSAQDRLMGKGSYTPKGIMDHHLKPDDLRAVKSYLGGVYSDLADTKIASIKNAEMRRDAALLNYSRRTYFDNALGVMFPYQFWYTRSMRNWALRAMTRPGIYANYARLRTMGSNVEKEGYPYRLQGKAGFKVPFLPEWMGDVYADPLRQVFNFEQVTRPFEQLATQKNQVQRRAETIINQMAADGKISQEDAAEALSAQSGMAWDRAMAQARDEVDREITNPMDFAFMMASPSLPISMAYNALGGKKERISQLPVTRMIQNVTTAAGIGGPRGVNIEAPFRKATGLPEFDRYEDFRVDRMLANMVADGVISPDDATRAMIDRQGPAFEAAQRRVSQVGLVKYIGAPMGIDVFPEGEQELRQMRTIYDAAIQKWKEGDNDAIQHFYDDYPEYEARLVAFQEPEERMRRFLISEVWGGYNDLATLEKRAARDQMGDLFNDGFLDKETRSYDSINTDTLAMWARAMGAQQLPERAPQTQQLPLKMPPQPEIDAVEGYYSQRDQQFPGISGLLDSYYDVPEGQRDAYRKKNPMIDAYYKWRNQFMATNPAAIEPLQSEMSELYGLPAHIQQGVYQYRATRDQQFPDIFSIQDQYYAMNDSANKSAFLKKHPELTAYWSWRREFAAQSPQLSPYIMSDESLAKAIRGEDGRTSSNYGASGSTFSNEWGLYNIERGKRYPQWRELQNTYYNLKDQNQSAAREFLNQNSQLREYWDWKRSYEAQHPGATTYSSVSTGNSEADRKKQDFAGFGFDMSQLPPMLLQTLMIYQYTGEEPGSGTMKALEYYWEQAGKPGGDLETFLEGYVQPLLANN